MARASPLPRHILRVCIGLGIDCNGHYLVMGILMMEVLSYVILPVWAGLVVWYAVYIERGYDE
jgi:hypothetical protein